MKISTKKAIISFILGSLLGVSFTLLMFDDIDAKIIFSISNSILGTILVGSLIMNKKEEKEVSRKIDRLFKDE